MSATEEIGGWHTTLAGELDVGEQEVAGGEGDG